VCGRFTMRANLKTVAGLFDVPEPPPTVRPRYNISPSQTIVAIRPTDDASKEWALLRWGLIPSWAADPKIGYKMINARSETVATKPSFRSAFKRRRCIIPADGYYEWKANGKQKQPYLFHRKGDAPFAFAGLWERWEQGDEPIESCTIITTSANGATREFHDRMPVILDEKRIAEWLDAKSEVQELTELLKPADEKLLIASAVSTLVNSPKNEDPTCVEPLESE
jgi:putative SOS response-associated peptidase YedK